MEEWLRKELKKWEFLSTALWKYNVQDLKVKALVAGVLRSLKCGGIWSGDSVQTLRSGKRGFME